MIVLLLAGTLATNRAALLDPGTAAEFYAVVPHAVMVALFGGVALFVVARARDRRGALRARAPNDARDGVARRSRRHERRAARRADAEPPARRGERLRHGARGAHAVAALAASRDVLRLHAVLRVDVRGDALSLAGSAGAIPVHELARACSARSAASG